MKKVTLAATLTLIATGCMTQQELMTKGERSEQPLKNPPAVAAACLARNFESIGSGRGWTGTVRALDAVTVEMIGNWGPDITAVLAHVKPGNEGSSATIWLRPYSFVGRDGLVPALLKGC